MARKSLTDDCNSTANECLLPYLLKHAGLDPLHGTFMKLFIRDIISLQQYELQEQDSVAFLFHNHVVVKVDIMGIIVRVDLKDTKHSYVVDDGTGVITCNLWRTSRKQLLPEKVNGLPESLLKKQLEMTSMYTLMNKGFLHGDLIHIRGCVVLFCGRKELDILDISKLDDPNCELDRVLQLPTLYSDCYCKPFNLPNQVSKYALNCEKGINIETLKVAVIKHVEDNIIVLDDFLLKDTFSWPSVLSLKNNSEDDFNEVCFSSMETTLESVSQTHGLICKRMNVESQYEVIKEGCTLTYEILKKMQMLSEDSQNAKKGLHVTQILEAFKNSSCYACVTPIVMQKAIQCLESTSDVISIDSNKYMLLI